LRKGWNFLFLRFRDLAKNGCDFNTWEIVKSMPVTISGKQEEVLEGPKSRDY
jgi:hypothetical protein